VLMALATTMATTPALALLQRGGGWGEAGDPGHRLREGG